MAQKVRFPVKTAIVVILLAAAVILLLKSQEIDYEIFFPIAIALFFVAVLAYGLKAYSRRRFTLFIWGMKALKFRKYDDSIRYFTDFLQYYKDNPKIERWKKMALGIRLTDVEAMTHFYLGVACYQNEKYEDALANFETSAEIAPDFDESQYNCAISSAKLGKNKQALMWLSKIKNPPKFLIERAKKAEEFNNIKNEKIFIKFIEHMHKNS
ncbi:MAG: tetratricopeptide repeat protein [Planctomycetes bacterium]|nr:tetratricopeptide repeat protein [Planctomycetota bacterium]